MNYLDPNDYVITRKRKKYKFAKFFNADNCFEFDDWKKRPVNVIEIGAGDGMFSVELATKYRDIIFVAIDVKADRLQKGAYQAIERGLENIYFVRARADQVGEMFGAGSIDKIWLTFSDPFPKKGSAGRRMTHPNFLRKYAELLRADGELLIKHDNTKFFQWSLEQLISEKWRIAELSFDVHESDLSGDYRILTAYEKRWLAEGLTTNFVKATK